MVTQNQIPHLVLTLSTMTTSSIDPTLWYGLRQLSFVPKHFIKCPTGVSTESKVWIQNNASGRYAFAKQPVTAANQLESDFFRDRIYFENNQDAIMYELMWSGI